MSVLPPPDPWTKARKLVDSVSAPYLGLTTVEVLLGIFLMALSGIGVLVHTFGPVPMDLSAPFVVLPVGWLVAAAIMLRRRLPERFHAFTTTLVRGMIWAFSLPSATTRYVRRWLTSPALTTTLSRPCTSSVS